MLRNIPITFLLLVILTSCYKPSPEYLKKEQEVSKLREVISSYCYISQDLDDSKIWNAGTIYFEDYYANLETEDKKILDNINNLLLKCNRELLVIAHASNYEASFISPLEISFNRAKTIYNYLLSLGIKRDNISSIFCGNNVNRFIEVDKKTQKYNQRAELILLPSNSDIEKGLFCSPNHY